MAVYAMAVIALLLMLLEIVTEGPDNTTKIIRNDQQRCLNDINREDGSSSWLTTPLKDEGIF